MLHFYQFNISISFAAQHTSKHTLSPLIYIPPLYHMFPDVQVHEVPFNSSNKWQMSIHHMKFNDKQLLLLKV